MEYEEREGNGSRILSFLIGGLVGAGITLLLAPKSGRETREQIRDLATDAREKAEDYYGQAREKFTSAIEKGKQVFREKEEELEGALETGKDIYEQEKGRFAPEA